MIFLRLLLFSLLQVWIRWHAAARVSIGYMACLVRSKRRLQFTKFVFHPAILRHNEFQELKRYRTYLCNENVGDSAVSICLMLAAPSERNTHSALYYVTGSRIVSQSRVLEMSVRLYRHDWLSVSFNPLTPRLLLVNFGTYFRALSYILILTLWSLTTLIGVVPHR